MYPDTKDASLVKDCLPEPPTPTSRALPRGVRIMRRICTVNNRDVKSVKVKRSKVKVIRPINAVTDNGAYAHRLEFP